MKIISEEQKELIDAITAEGLAGNLSAFILEKDIHVTDALHALAKLQHRHIRFVFCGGTSLSKAHGLIERMSEDVDLKVVLDAGRGLTQSGMKTHLGRLKNAAIDVMTALAFRSLKRNSERSMQTVTLRPVGVTKRAIPLTPACGLIQVSNLRCVRRALPLHKNPLGI
jgi:hypothetical protein